MQSRRESFASLRRSFVEFERAKRLRAATEGFFRKVADGAIREVGAQIVRWLALLAGFGAGWALLAMSGSGG